MASSWSSAAVPLRFLFFIHVGEPCAIILQHPLAQTFMRSTLEPAFSTAACGMSPMAPVRATNLLLWHATQHDRLLFTHQIVIAGVAVPDAAQ